MEKDRLFAGVYPEGIVYADTATEENGDYKRLAFLSFRLLELAIVADCPADLKAQIEQDARLIQEKVGQEYPTDCCGHKITLGCGL